MTRERGAGAADAWIGRADQGAARSSSSMVFVDAGCSPWSRLATASAWCRTRSRLRPASFAEIAVAPAPPNQLGEERRETGHVLQPVGTSRRSRRSRCRCRRDRRRRPADVVDMVGHLRQRRPGRRVRGFPLLERRRFAPAVSARPSEAAPCRGPAARRQPRASGETKAGTNVTMTTPPFVGSRREDRVGHVARMIDQGAGRGMREDDRRLARRRGRRSSSPARRARGPPASRAGSSRARPRGRTA